MAYPDKLAKRSFILAVGLLLPTLAIGEDALQRFAVRLDPLDIEPAAVEALVRLGGSFDITLERLAKLGDIVARHCGNVDPVYFDALQLANNARFGADRNLEIAAGETLSLPACIPAPRLEAPQQVIGKADSVWKYYAPYKKVFDWNIADGQLIALRGAGGAEPPGFDPNAPLVVPASGQAFNYPELFRQLNGGKPSDSGNLPVLIAGETAAVPRPAERWVSFESPAGARTSEEVGAAFGLDERDVVDLSTTFQHVGDRSISRACTAGIARADHDNELSRILVELRSSQRRNRQPVDSVRIHVIDSGIYARDGAAIGPDRIESPDRPFALLQGIEDNARARYEPVSAPDIDHLRDHGTKVAYLALGGRGFADNSDADFGFPIRLVPTRIYEVNRGIAYHEEGGPITGRSGGFAVAVRGVLKEELILQAFGNAGFDIYNLSLGRVGELGAFFHDLLGRDKPSLFVAAAGNHGIDIDEQSFFPASYGGDGAGRYNLISVASVDGDGKLSGFSNYGFASVDIAAPGCEVATEGFDVEADRHVPASATGTSFAAPQVSFVAAILRAAFPRQPAEFIKTRILQSADLEEGLADRITDGRVLNARKALSVDRDVVEVVNDDGSTRLERGRLPKAFKIADFCADHREAKGQTLLKVRFGFDGLRADSGRNVVYWRDSVGTLRRKSCEAAMPELVLQKDRSRLRLHGLKLRDLVLRSR